MQVITQIEECREAVRKLRKGGETVGLVPTMGALHDGHVSLIRAARGRCASVAVSIFVNPTQFAPQEDLEAYPRPLKSDLDLCEANGAAIVFTPDAAAMYPAGSTTKVVVGGLTAGLCGPLRPGHFDGVATVVNKLFHILPTDKAFFGEKDYQQLTVIRRMVVDLNIPIEIVGCPTVREKDGLAMSSRNTYLSADERIQARSLSQGLYNAVELARQGERNSAALKELVRREILTAGSVQIEYIEVVDSETLQPVITLNGRARICVAVRIGKTRLIDNMEVKVHAPADNQSPTR